MQLENVQIVKYVSLSLAFLVSFLGAWFFEYTKSDSTINRKVLTKPGKIAFILAIIGATLGLITTIKSDRDNFQNEKKLKTISVSAEEDRSKIIQLIENLSLQMSINSPTPKRTYRERKKTLSQEYDIQYSEKDSREALDKLKEDYPDLAKMIKLATTPQQLFNPLMEGYNRNFDNRISDIKSCKEVQFKKQGIFSYFELKVSNDIALRIFLSKDGTSISVIDYGTIRQERDIDWSKGFGVELVSNERIILKCSYKPSGKSGSCSSNLSDAHNGNEILSKLREGPVVIWPKSSPNKLFKLKDDQTETFVRALNCTNL
jgi:hypothetical protein